MTSLSPAVVSPQRMFSSPCGGESPLASPHHASLVDYFAITPTPHKLAVVAESPLERPSLVSKSDSVLLGMTLVGEQPRTLGRMLADPKPVRSRASESLLAFLPALFTPPPLQKSSTQVSPHLPRPRTTLPLPAGAVMVEAPQLEPYLRQGPDRLLVVDTRLFNDYVDGHLPQLLNICLPLTLLKRPAFTLARVVALLNDHERQAFTVWGGVCEALQDTSDAPALLYDGASADAGACSLQLASMAAKFTQHGRPVWVLQGGFAAFAAAYPEHVETGTNESLSVHSPTTPSCPLRTTNLLPPVTTPLPGPLSSPAVCLRFLLPKFAPVFRTRHYDEVQESEVDATVQLKAVEQPLTAAEAQRLPEWARQVILDPHAVRTLQHKFGLLELKEKERLQYMFSSSSHRPLLLQGEHDNLALAHAGLELGGKNRYKDIFPYEHLRAKLQSTNHVGSDYINASLVGANHEYIATQGPLLSTVGDFWRMVVDYRSAMVILLTEEYEGGVNKCAAYWVSGVYDGITVREVELLPHPYVDRIVLRRFEVEMGAIRHSVLQVHMLSWPDLATLDPLDVLAVVDVRQRVLQQLPNAGPVVVHCSAGCGRTGTFCAVDTLVGAVLRGTVFSGNTDPVYDVVDALRKQRVLMVQTLRQYVLVYDSVLLRMRQGLQTSTVDIVERFLATNE